MLVLSFTAAAVMHHGGHGHMHGFGPAMYNPMEGEYGLLWHPLPTPPPPNTSTPPTSPPQYQIEPKKPPFLTNIPKYHSKIDKLWITMKRINCDWVTWKLRKWKDLHDKSICIFLRQWHNIVLQMIVFYSCCWCWYYFVLLCTMEWFISCIFRVI